MNRVSRHVFGLKRILSILLASCGLCTHAMGQANIYGQWTTLSYTMPINPIHAHLMQNGEVLIVAGSGNYTPNTNYQAAVWNTQTGIITTQPLSWDMFCNGMIALPDGRPFIFGGTLQYNPSFEGLPNTSYYDPNTGNFVDLQNMADGRWYPTGTMLGDGRVMVFSGLDENGSTNITVEFYTVSTGWSTPSAMPFSLPTYPRMHLLPSGMVFYSAPGAYPDILNPSNLSAYTVVGPTNCDCDRTYGSSVLLPLTPANNYDPQVMILGGGYTPTNTTEIVDLGAANPQWQYSAPMSQPRVEMDAVLLPTGTVLAVGGSAIDEDANTASLNADLFDPVAGTMSSAGTNAYPRLYHSNALLLPDATVALFGGNPVRGTYEPHIEIYSPAYLFTTDSNGNPIPATQPTISSVTPGVIGYGSSFQVTTPDASSIASVVLIRPGSPTHAFDMDQRLVGLSFTQGSGVLNVTGPPNGNIAPPGYYMLFILNTSGVPSVATFIQLSLAPTDQPPAGTIVSPSSNVSIQAGQSVSFSGTGTDPNPNGTITGYSWVFPGGSPALSLSQNPGSVIFPTAGTYVTSLTVTDNFGLNDPSPPTATITVLPAFTLSPTPTSTTVAAGGAASYTVTLTPASGFTGTVSFSVSGLPTGVTGTFNPSTLNTSGSTTLSITTSSSTPVGTYPLTITGTSGQAISTTTVSLTVTAAPNFTLSASPTSATVVEGGKGTSTITTTVSGGFNSKISLSATGAPSGTTVKLSPSSFPAPGSGSSVMTVSVGSSTAAGTYTITVTGSGLGIKQNAMFTLTVVAAIAYAQGNYATAQTAQTVSVTFTAAQAARDLNVVVVGWKDTTAVVNTVTDSSGNTYALAAGPTLYHSSTEPLSQSIYYAKNIVAAARGANSVTVTFSAAAVAPDIRILEYSGADPNNPVDVTAASSGSSLSSSSGSATTTNATDLIFGANIVWTRTTGPGSGFTERLLTSPDGDIAEDKMVKSTGKYSATAPLARPAGAWIMQMVAFR